MLKRPSPPLLLVAALLGVVALLVVNHRCKREQVPLATSGEPLVALPRDRTGERSLGNGVAVDVPAGWFEGAGPILKPIAFRSGPEHAWTERLRIDCTAPVVLRWRDQWRGECLGRSGTRVRGAVIRTEDGWRGVEARYPDGQDARMAPRVARMLASLRPVP